MLALLRANAWPFGCAALCCPTEVNCIALYRVEKAIARRRHHGKLSKHISTTRDHLPEHKARSLFITFWFVCK
ncbi:hypothetical protein [Nostoc sp. CCY 9925]|uniref:hypothetical protein n=1 Tax=Nostoc sp. CCY 9925 TaxID=3103865 RepID=UPI0039C6E841